MQIPPKKIHSLSARNVPWITQVNTFNERLEITNTPQASDIYFLLMSHVGSHSCFLCLHMLSHPGNQDEGSGDRRREIKPVGMCDAFESSPSGEVNEITFHWLKHVSLPAPTWMDKEVVFPQWAEHSNRCGCIALYRKAESNDQEDNTVYYNALRDILWGLRRQHFVKDIVVSKGLQGWRRPFSGQS